MQRYCMQRCHVSQIHGAILERAAVHMSYYSFTPDNTPNDVYHMTIQYQTLNYYQFIKLVQITAQSISDFLNSETEHSGLKMRTFTM